jgi:class 3 adenylate cyclase
MRGQIDKAIGKKQLTGFAYKAAATRATKCACAESLAILFWTSIL